MNSDIKWQKSSFSEVGAQCIQIAHHDGGILLRESDDPNVVTTTSPTKFAAFISGVKTGMLDHFTD
ncbi:DUF397 domain-containing protein [Streptomyces sp. NPDC059255]|uniref:DUF397 domain-containing protein n=1 Tax=Streptomyces sp. NPDC059255 TaxID=3346793 RepID=UPI00369997C8